MSISEIKPESNTSRVRITLGGATFENTRHVIAKLDNGKYSVGNLREGMSVEVSTDQFESVDTAFDAWYMQLPK